MNQEQKMEIALFRFGAIADLVGGVRLDKREKGILIKKQSEKQWNIPCSSKTRISESTVRRWIKIYENNGRRLESLCPKGRKDSGNSRSIDPETGAALLVLKKEFSFAPAKILIEKMRERRLITPGTRLYPSTVYRFLKQNGAFDLRGEKVDRRRFEAESPNDIWQSDVMHGPSVRCDGKLKKTYLIAFIDDHSRYIPFAGFFFSENTETFVGAFEAALSTRGLPRKLYVDNGSAFRSKRLEFAAADLGISLVHAKPYQPQGKGKIERFFRTIRSRFLPYAEMEDLITLSDSLKRWLERDYHRSKHSGTGEAPEDRYFNRIELLRPAPDDLMRYFRHRAKRKVTSDRVVSLEGKMFEAPVALIGEKVDLLYHHADMEQIEVRHQGKNYGFIKQVNTGVNARTGRGKSNEITLGESNSVSKGGKLSFNTGREVGQ